MAVAVPGHQMNGDGSEDQYLAALASILSDQPHEFLRPTLGFQHAAMQAAKAVLDPLASDIANIQITRRDDNRRKRKRDDSSDQEPVLQLRQVYTKGFGVKQVWEQAKRVLDAACYEVEREIEQFADKAGSAVQNSVLDGEVNSIALSQDEQSGDADDNDVKDFGSRDTDDSEDGKDLGEGNSGSEQEDDMDDIEAVSEDDEDSDIEQSSKGQSIFVQDKHGLNDGFFSIDDFNKQSQFLEQMDARGDEDNPSDEDEVDWDADPLTTPFMKPKPSKSRSEEQDDQEDDDDDTDEDNGPTFGNANLNGDDDDDDEEFDMLDAEDEGLEDAMGLSNANEIRYSDFYEPPPKKPSKTKRMRALPKTQPVPKSKPESEDNAESQMQNDIERAIADVRRDLLDSDEEDDNVSDEEEGSQSDDSMVPRKPKTSTKNMSTHEKQRAAIAAEIRQLEAANVAKRDWQLSGEARAADRPINSLIEEDLEFERAGKPVPVVTAETSEEIEQLIKRRILAKEFDEVIRRLPGSANVTGDTRRGRVEVDDQKATVGLGEIYEQEHLRNSDPLNYVDKRSAATKKQHEQIDVLWKEVRDQLDALSNLHFKPKRVEVQMKTVEDKPRIAMEDARPIGEIEAGEGGMLAPQEVYKPGIDSKSGGDEVLIRKTGATLNREELSREEKLRRRRREKERNKKAGTNPSAAHTSASGQKKGRKPGKASEKADIISDLKRGNVRVIGKGGELQTIENGRKNRGETKEVIVSNLKL